MQAGGLSSAEDDKLDIGRRDGCHPLASPSVQVSQLGRRGDQLDPGSLQPVRDNPREPLGNVVTERGVGRTACSHGPPVELEGLNGASGHGVGVIASLDLYLDDLLPDTLGKPLFNPFGAK